MRGWRGGRRRWPGGGRAGGRCARGRRCGGGGWSRRGGRGGGDLGGAADPAGLVAAAGLSMDVSVAPLLDVHVARAGERWLALVRLHHLAQDHTGMETLVAEVGEVLAGRGGLLAEPLPFRD